VKLCGSFEGWQVPRPGDRGLRPVVQASAQRASGLFIVVDRMPANAGARCGRSGLITWAVGRPGHGRPAYADGPTFFPSAR